jgi:hypothetical protein
MGDVERNDCLRTNGGVFGGGERGGASEWVCVCVCERERERDGKKSLTLSLIQNELQMPSKKYKSHVTSATPLRPLKKSLWDGFINTKKGYQ